MSSGSEGCPQMFSREEMQIGQLNSITVRIRAHTFGSSTTYLLTPYLSIFGIFRGIFGLVWVPFLPCIRSDWFSQTRIIWYGKFRQSHGPATCQWVTWTRGPVSAKKNNEMSEWITLGAEKRAEVSFLEQITNAMAQIANVSYIMK